MNLRKTKVLIVDDARVAREILRNMLKEIDVTDVFTAGNGNEALEVLSQQKVDLILSDWNMPGMDGLELLRSVRGSGNLKHIPFIMVTAERMQENIVQAVQEGVSGYIKKPFGSQELQKKIRQAMRLE